MDEIFRILSQHPCDKSSTYVKYNKVEQYGKVEYFKYFTWIRDGFDGSKTKRILLTRLNPTTEEEIADFFIWMRQNIHHPFICYDYFIHFSNEEEAIHFKLRWLAS